MDVLYGKGRATMAGILESIADPPSYSTVRVMLRVQEDKKHIRPEEENLRYVYTSVVTHDKARRSAAAPLLDTFFDGSAEQAVATRLDISARDLKPEDFDRVSTLIDRAREGGTLRAVLLNRRNGFGCVDCGSVAYICAARGWSCCSF